MAVNIKSVGGVGLQNALKQLQEKLGQGAHVRVGFLEGTEEDHKPTATIAAYNEFGTSTSPPRPFMRKTVADHKDGWGKMLGKALKSSGYSVDQALVACGETMKDQMENVINDYNDPSTPNSPVTNLLKDRFPVRDRMTEKDVWKAMQDVKKGKTAPPGSQLVWSDQMKNSVAYDIKDGPE